MTAREFASWEAFYRVEPWGEEREDLRMGIVCSVLSASRGQRSKPGDYIPQWWSAPKPAQTSDQILGVVRGWVAKTKAKESKASV